MRYSCFLVVFITSLFVLCLMTLVNSTCAQGIRIHVKQLPNLPNEVGVAGAYAGRINDSLLIAGGANFPQSPPWEGGDKVWHREIYCYDFKDRSMGTLTNLLSRVTS
jgi:N-acetylneuraminic acid mutarotase